MKAGKTMKTHSIEEIAFAQISSTASTQAPRRRLWTGRALAGLPLLFLAWDATMKLVAIPQVVEASAKLGFARGTLPVLGTVEVVGVLLTLFQRTRILGAVLLSAYLGGAVAVHVQHGDPLLTHTLFPIFFALLIWGGFSLLDPRVRALSPFARA
jgi:hypothetical protein